MQAEQAHFGVRGLCWSVEINSLRIQTLRLIRQIRTSPSVGPQGSPAGPASPQTAALRALPSGLSGKVANPLATKTCVHRIESEREEGAGLLPEASRGAWRRPGALAAAEESAQGLGSGSRSPHSRGEEALRAAEKCRVSDVACLLGPTRPQTG